MRADVLLFQRQINAAGHHPPLVEDGIRGPKTIAAEAWYRARFASSRWVDAVPGIDVSGHQGVIDGARIQAFGYRWGIVKATEGTGYVSRTHGPGQVAQFRGAGMALAGLYHFPGRAVKLGDGTKVRVTEPAREEAEHYLRTVDAWGGLPDGASPVLDLEGCDYRHTHAQAVRWWVEWIAIVETALERPVLRYSLAAYLWAHARDAPAALRARLADGPLWWAEYGTRTKVRLAPTKDPAPWRPDQIVIHQYEGRQGHPAAQVPGVATTCDVNRMRREEWTALATAQGVEL